MDITTKNNEELERLQKWTDSWLIDINTNTTKCMVVNLAHTLVLPHPKMNGADIELVENHKHLGVVLNNKEKWTHQIDARKNKAWKRIRILRSLKYKLSRESLRTICVSHIRSLLEFSIILWDNCTNEDSDTINDVHKEALI